MSTQDSSPPHSLDVLLKIVERHIDHRNLKSRLTGELRLIEGDRAAQSCFQSECSLEADIIPYEELELFVYHVADS